MRHLLYYLLFVLYLPLHSLLPQPNFVTYEFSGGRFGDNLLTYLRAKWVSDQYQIPLLYKPFPYSSELMLHDVDHCYNPRECRHCQILYFQEGSNVQPFSKDVSRLYVCSYFPECPWERTHLKGPNGAPWNFFQVDWENPEFRARLEKLIAPKQHLFLTIPPQDKISIAIHFREGGGYDKGDWALNYLTKAPPLDFYIEGLLQVVSLFPERSLYCHLFTDALKPDQIIESFAKALPSETDITFDCRSKGNSHTENVLEDFFSLFNFDVLIHPHSNFSLIPALIHDYAITYSPLSGKRKGNTAIIDKVKFEINEELYKKLLHGNSQS